MRNRIVPAMLVGIALIFHSVADVHAFGKRGKGLFGWRGSNVNADIAAPVNIGAPGYCTPGTPGCPGGQLAINGNGGFEGQLPDAYYQRTVGGAPQQISQPGVNVAVGGQPQGYYAAVQGPAPGFVAQGPPAGYVQSAAPSVQLRAVQSAPRASSLDAAIADEEARFQALQESITNRQISAIQEAGELAQQRIALETQRAIEAMNIEGVEADQARAEAYQNRDPSQQNAPGPAPQGPPPPPGPHGP